MGGRPRKPTALKKKTGTLEKHLHESEMKLQEELEKLPPPDVDSIKLGSVRSQKHFTEITSKMKMLDGWLAETDLEALAAHCLVYDLLVKATLDLKRYGMVREGRVTPYFKVYKDVHILYMKGCTEFGLTPVSRTRIRIGEQKESDNGLGDLNI